MEKPGRRSLTKAELHGEFEDGTTGTTKLDYSLIVWRVRVEMKQMKDEKTPDVTTGS